MTMKIDYGTQISPFPIELPIGTLKKPTLEDIAKITFDRFSFYELLLLMTPEMFYTTLKKDDEFWKSLDKTQKNEITMFDILIRESELQSSFEQMFNYFFVQSVTYTDGFFILSDTEINNINDINPDDIRGSISNDNFLQVLELIQQVCGINSDEKKSKELKFKNKLAKDLYHRLQQSKLNSRKRANMDLSLPNIISAVCGSHNSLNFNNIWQLTIFQLLDVFTRMQNKSIYDIDSLRVSVWGDEKNTFNHSLWYKNYYDKNDEINHQ